MMITLSENAQKSLQDYLRQARMYLRGSKSIDASDVEQNITEYIENELEGATEPVSCDVLDAVLKKLGRPQQWVPMEELPWWWRIIFRLRSGPEDWRLAYISFGLLILGFLIIPSFIVLIPASFIVSRAALSVAEDHQIPSPQKWLIYPSLIIVYVFVLSALLTWPLGILIPLAEEFEHSIRVRYARFADDLDYWIMATSFIIAGLGLCWIILGSLLLKWWGVLQMLFRPFAGRFNRKWALFLLLIGFVLMIPSLGLGIWYWLEAVLASPPEFF
jgi:hypothetical protein